MKILKEENSEIMETLTVEQQDLTELKRTSRHTKEKELQAYSDTDEIKMPRSRG